MTESRGVRLLGGLRSLREYIATVMAAGGGIGGALVILGLLIIAFHIATPDFLTLTNLRNIVIQYSVAAILAIGQTLVIISRGIDLSVAATAALAGCLTGVAFAHWGLPEPVALLIGLGAGFAVGAFNGFVITSLKVPDFIATLGGLSWVRGVALLVTAGLPVPDHARAEEGRTIPVTAEVLGSQSLFGIPLIVLVVGVCALLAMFVLKWTTLGRSAYAVGGNPEAARASGIRVERTKMYVYILSGLFAAIAGLILVGRQGSANALMADQMELQSIAAVVVGGTYLFGGQGGISGTLIGVLIIGVLANGLSILGITEFWQQVINGLIIVVVVALDQWRRRTARRNTS